MKDKKDYKELIAQKEKELEELKLEVGDNCGIKPSETRALIEKWYGHCFTFIGYESGSMNIMLRTIIVDRKKEKIWLDGNIIAYITPDISFIPEISGNSISAVPYGGKLLISGKIEINAIPYFIEFDWNEPIAEELDKFLESREITKEKFSDDILKADPYCDNFDYLEPLDEVKKDNESGWDYDYKEIFGAL